jgi:hypothetical protein
MPGRVDLRLPVGGSGTGGVERRPAPAPPPSLTRSPDLGHQSRAGERPVHLPGAGWGPQRSSKNSSRIVHIFVPFQLTDNAVSRRTTMLSSFADHLGRYYTRDTAPPMAARLLG